MTGTLVLIDGSALAHRSHFAFAKNPLYNSRGENTGAVFGYTNSLLKILEDFEPTHAAVCFDTEAPTFRHRKFAEYKATREKMDPEMRNQMPTIRDVTEALGVSVVQMDGFEADDIIGTLARKAVREDYSVYLVSGDKDFLQLVSDRIRVVSPGRMGSGTVVYDSEKVVGKFEVPPGKVADLLALAGDKVDNVPGVRGIGLKGAARLMQDFRSVEELLENISRIDRPGLREKIEANRDQLLVSKELVTIKVDVPVDVEVKDIRRKEMDAGRLRDLLRRLEFFSLLKKLDVNSQLNNNYVPIEDPGRLGQLLPRSGAVGLFVQDAEIPVPSVLAVSWGEGEAGLIDASLIGTSNAARARLGELLSNPSVVVVSEDVKQDMRTLGTWGIDLSPPFVDTSVASYLLDPDRRDHSLAYHMEREFGLSLPEVISRRKKGEGDSDLFRKQMVAGACSRADAALRLRGPLLRRLEEDGLLRLYTDVELPLVEVLADMENAGVLIDVDFFRKLSGEMGEELQSLEEEIYGLAGERFNIRSSKQLAVILFEKLGLPPGRKTKTGYSTSQDLLEKLSLEHELPAVVLKYRDVHKRKSTYVDALPGLVSEETGRIHTTFNQTVAATGRLSSSEPNLQNIPMRTELGRELRKGFIAGEGNLLLSLDYSQVELRILAHVTGERSLIEAFEEGRDIHTETAAILFGARSDDVTVQMRNTAKMVNYGLVYGMSSYGLARRLSIGQKEAQHFMDTYFAGLPRVKGWIDSTVDGAREKGYTTTMMGRRRYHRDINSRDPGRREIAVRAAINSPIQGSAADMIKAAMVAIHGVLARNEAMGRMIVQIHDELLFEVPRESVDDVSGMAEEKMVSALDLDVPIEVEAGHGPDWFTAHK